MLMMLVSWLVGWCHLLGDNWRWAASLNQNIVPVNIWIILESVYSAIANSAKHLCLNIKTGKGNGKGIFYLMPANRLLPLLVSNLNGWTRFSGHFRAHWKLFTIYKNFFLLILELNWIECTFFYIDFLREKKKSLVECLCSGSVGRW